MLKEDDPKWSFVAMENHAVIPNRTFLVTVTATQMRGARVRGVLASPPESSPDWDAVSLAFTKLEAAAIFANLTAVDRAQLKSLSL